MDKKQNRLTEIDLKEIVKESVNKVLREAQVGRGTTTTRSKSGYADEYHDHTTYHFNTSENPYSNDSVQMLANRFEKRLGGGYKVSVFNNPQNIDSNDFYSDTNQTTNDSNVIEFKVATPNSNDSNVQDIMYIAKVANQLFSNMDGARINIVGIDFDYDYDDVSTQSITLSVVLNNINEPRKDMIPKGGNGFESTNFKKPKYWSYTEY